MSGNHFQRNSSKVAVSALIATSFALSTLIATPAQAEAPPPSTPSEPSVLVDVRVSDENILEHLIEENTDSHDDGTKNAGDDVTHNVVRSFGLLPPSLLPSVNDANAGVKMGQKISVQTGKPNSSVLGNLTVTDSKTNGFTTSWPCDEELPNASVNNYTANAWAIPNFTAVNTDSEGYACFYTSGQTDLLFDQYGYATNLSAGAPVRKFDTRELNSKLPKDGVFVYRTGKPNSAVMGNLTVTGTEGAGFTTAYPCSTGKPNSSVNNYTSNQTVPNFTTVKTDENGDVCFYTTTPIHLLFDEVASVGEDVLTAQKPERLLDTREINGGNRVPSGNFVTVQTGKPETTILGNLTVTGGLGRGYTTLWNCEGELPVASVNNYSQNQTVPNFAAVQTNKNGEFCVFVSTTAHVIWDSMAYTNTFLFDVPERKMDTRLWGLGAQRGDDSHWSPLVNLNNEPARWDVCKGPINVYINPANGGAEQIGTVQEALNRITEGSGISFRYAGTTNVVPNEENLGGYYEQPEERSLIIAFASPEEANYLSANFAGVGGFIYLGAEGGGAAEAEHGYTVINSTTLPLLSEDIALALYMHEIGHAIGLGHYDDTAQVMNPTLYNYTGKWGRGDLHGLHSVGRASGCLNR